MERLLAVPFPVTVEQHLRVVETRPGKPGAGADALVHRDSIPEMRFPLVEPACCAGKLAENGRGGAYAEAAVVDCDCQAIVGQEHVVEDLCPANVSQKTGYPRG